MSCLTHGSVFTGSSMAVSRLVKLLGKKFLEMKLGGSRKDWGGVPHPAGLAPFGK